MICKEWLMGLEFFSLRNRKLEDGMYILGIFEDLKRKSSNEVVNILCVASYLRAGINGWK